jgi:hypothetical protein
MVKRMTWTRVSQCTTKVGDYEPVHDMCVGGSLTRGVGPRRRTNDPLKHRVKHKLGGKISVRIDAPQKEGPVK